MARIILIDPDRDRLLDMQSALEVESHTLQTFLSPDFVLQDISRFGADLVVMALRYPSGDGLTVFERIQDDFDVPVLLTSLEGGPTEEAMVLRLGAEDYIRAPFSMRVLAARTAAALRRNAMRGASVEEDAAVLTRGPLRLNRLRHEVHWDDKEIVLTPTEFNVLWIIAQRPGQVLSRANILDLAYGGDVFVTDRSIDSQIKRIRRKLRAVAPQFSAIETLYGLGYRFSDSPEDVAA